jgi:hypothetical protein
MVSSSKASTGKPVPLTDPISIIHQMSAFQFTIQNTPITEKQAVALVSTGSDGENLPTIELTKIFKIKKVNAKMLFNEAVQKNDEDLARLAWKLSTLTNYKQPKTARAGRSVPYKIPDDRLNVGTVIEALCRSKSNWAAGVCIVLWCTYQAEDPHGLNALTIKGMCEMFVNQSYYDDELSENNPVYQGFAKAPNDMSPAFNAEKWFALISKKQSEDGITYHNGPLYAAMRGGVLWAKEHKLIELKEHISYGSYDNNPEGPGSKTQRKYYTAEPTDFGRSVACEWEDCLDVAYLYFRNI